MLCYFHNSEIKTPILASSDGANKKYELCFLHDSKSDAVSEGKEASHSTGKLHRCQVSQNCDWIAKNTCQKPAGQECWCATVAFTNQNEYIVLVSCLKVLETSSSLILGCRVDQSESDLNFSVRKYQLKQQSGFKFCLFNLMIKIKVTAAIYHTLCTNYFMSKHHISDI